MRKFMPIARRLPHCSHPRRQPSPKSAEDYPNKPVRVLVTVPAGGGVDTVTRLVTAADVREARPGLRRREPRRRRRQHRRRSGLQCDHDGYQLMASQPSPITTNIELYKKLSYDPTRFEFIGIMSSAPNVPAGEERLPGQDGPGVHGLRQEEPRQGELCLAGSGHDVASDRRTVPEADGHQAGPRSVQGHRTGAERSGRRPCGHDLHAASAAFRTCTRARRPASSR